MFKTPELQNSFSAGATKMFVKAGDSIMTPGQYIKMIPIIIKGCLRVLRENNTGDETFLYHVMPGETCALSLTCCSMYKPSEVRALAEDDTELWAIPIEKLDEWQEFKEWREFIGTTYMVRFDKLLRVIDDIAFHNMDERLWKYLRSRARAKDNFIIESSHEEIARELHMQRESATRLLKKLKDMGFIETSRNQIRIIKKDALV